MNNRLYGNLIFELSHPGRRGYSLPNNEFGHYELPEAMRRNEDAQLPECDELTVIRHYTNLSANNFGVNNGFYPLGSCTMKYNPIINEEVAAMPQFAALHPLQPEQTCQGALQVYYEMQKSLAAITGLSEFTLNPFAGAHGELTGLMIIRAYHQSRGDMKRTKVIVPDSAHGTNPASAAVCGLEIAAVDGADDVGARQHEQVVVALLLSGQVCEAFAAVVGFGQVVTLYHGAHGAVDDQDAAARLAGNGGNGVHGGGDGREE